jgi:uncharacterized membrane protein YeiH
VSDLLFWGELAGTLAFAYGGVEAARRKRLDLVGAFVAAFLSAFGGGTLRDVLLQRQPLFWIAHPEQPLLVFALTLVMMLATRGRPLSDGGWPLALVDAVGLGLFTAAGVSIAAAQGVPAFPATLFGVMTATFGGLLRDVSTGEVPGIFKQNPLYASCAFIGSCIYMLLASLLPGTPWPYLTCVLLTAVLRLLALRLNWTLPV